ncbi:MAG: hypothetical protein H0Z32_14475 [Bacillaceae bacterium]|nr:hypothetical protein [Bacillaceae bacterium]
MLIKINEEKYYISDNEEAGMFLKEQFEKYRNNENKIIDHVIADNETFYEGYENYIMENIEQVNEVTIVIKSIKGHVIELFKSLNQYLENATSELKKITGNEQYDFTKEKWKNIRDLIEALQWIYQLDDYTNSLIEENIPENYTHISSEIKKSLEFLPEMLQAIEVKDKLLIFDLLFYEVLPFFETLQHECIKMLKKESKTDVN